MKLDLITTSTRALTASLGLGLLLVACSCADLEGARSPREPLPKENAQASSPSSDETTDAEVARNEQARLQPAGEVVINDHELSQRELADFRARYGVEPGAGRYWYDSRCGMWGLEGAAASGFIFPGHSIGRLAAKASSGSSSIFLNGREMADGEVSMFQSLLGAQILPGRYWLDGYGNYGYEEFAFASGNLYTVIAARGNGGGRGGNGGGGDNYWSTRYAAGNSNADNSVGYVYIPGTGSVTYGM